MKRAVLASLLVLGACFSKPGFRDRDAGTGDTGTQIDAPDVTPAGPPRLAAGHHHACAIDAMTRLWCWGDNTFGQLGSSALPASGRPLLAFPGPNEMLWTSVSAGDQHTCGIRNTTLYCWGNNDFMQSGGTNAPNTITFGGVAVRVIAGHKSTCAVDTMKHLWCWGLIDPNAGGLPTYTQIGPTQLENWANVSLGSTHACALTTTGTTACWGKNDNRQLGDTGADRGVDTATVLVGTFLQIAANERATCGITPNHELKCVGSNATGLLSNQFDGTMQGTPTAVTIGGTLSWSHIALGTDHACGLTATGVVCYGHSSTGAMGNGFTSHEPPAPVTMPGGMGAVTEIVAGDGFSCARDVAGIVACWGSNQYGENGDGTIASTTTPWRVDLQLSGSDAVQAVTAGDGHSCALIAAGAPTRVKCWGDNRLRQVDSTTTQFQPLPTQSATGVTSISAGESHTCGVTTGGDVQCWGSNVQKQLGYGGSNGTNTLVHGVNAYTQVAAGSTSSCAVTAATAIPGNELYCWGTTPGQGTLMMPTLLSAMSHAWTAIALGSGFGVGQVNANELGAFGDPCKFGQSSGTFPHDSPAQLSANLALPFTLAASQSQGEHVCALLTGSPDPFIRCWGSNLAHQITTGATGTCNINLTPPSPGGVRRWAVPGPGRISAANAHTCAIVDETPGTAGGNRVYCWGYNPGSLGFNPNNVGVPSKAATALVATQVATGPNHLCAIGRLSGDTQDQVYCWGQNRTGEVGNGSRFHDTPVLAMFQ